MSTVEKKLKNYDLFNKQIYTKVNKILILGLYYKNELNIMQLLNMLIYATETKCVKLLMHLLDMPKYVSTQVGGLYDTSILKCKLNDM